MSAIPLFYCSLRSGILDVRRLLGMGLKIGMGTGRNIGIKQWLLYNMVL